MCTHYMEFGVVAHKLHTLLTAAEWCKCEQRKTTKYFGKTGEQKPTYIRRRQFHRWETVHWLLHLHCDPNHDPAITRDSNDPNHDPAITRDSNNPNHDPAITQDSNDPNHDPAITQDSNDPNHDPAITRDSNDANHDPAITRDSNDPNHDPATTHTFK